MDRTKALKALKALSWLYMLALEWRRYRFKFFEGEGERKSIRDEIHQILMAEIEFLGKVQDARVKLVASGFDVPEAWLTLNVYPVSSEREDRSKGGFITVFETVPPDRSPIQAVLDQMYVAEMKLRHAQGETSTPAAPKKTARDKKSAQQTSSSEEWWKTSGPPSGWFGSSLEGTLKDLTNWCGFKVTNTMRTHNGVGVWVQKRHRTLYEVHFPTEAQFAIANQRRLASQPPTASSAKELQKAPKTLKVSGSKNSKRDTQG